MTNKEAIETLRANYPDACFGQLREAVDMAIEALEKSELSRPADDAIIHQMAIDIIEQIKWERDIAIQQLKDLGYSLGEKIRTDGDTISRQAAIDTLTNLDYTPGEWATKGLSLCKDAIKAISSAHSEIIWCKDCQHNNNCHIQYQAQAGDMFFCGAAERRTDG